MSMGASEVRAFAAELSDAPQHVVNEVPGVVKKGAVNIVTQMRNEMGASKSFGMLAGGISFDLLDDGFTAEIGPTKANRGGASKIGKGANIAYFGGANGGGGTVPDPQVALDAEVPRFEQALQNLIGDL